MARDVVNCRRGCQVDRLQHAGVDVTLDDSLHATVFGRLPAEASRIANIVVVDDSYASDLRSILVRAAARTRTTRKLSRLWRVIPTDAAEPQNTRAAAPTRARAN